LLPLNELVLPPTTSAKTTENKSAPLPALYVFVDIKIDIEHLYATLSYNIDRSARLVLASTVQFLSSLHAIHHRLSDYFTSVEIPQIKPLSKGEILGCTAPTLPEIHASGKINVENPESVSSPVICVFVADGRFHLESWMIANPTHTFYQYNPYSLSFTKESYDHSTMLQVRYDAVMRAKEARHWVIILGTLGRQGSLRIASRMETLLSQRNIRFTRLLLSEIFPAKLALMKDVDCFVQIACPRLYVDWGYAFHVPVLSTYEAEVALGTRLVNSSHSHIYGHHINWKLEN
jgi:2-(3-amino-3-carboxypropyl)histidine synthase